MTNAIHSSPPVAPKPADNLNSGKSSYVKSEIRKPGDGSRTCVEFGMAGDDLVPGVDAQERAHPGNGQASKSQPVSSQYNTIFTRTANGEPMSFAEVLHSLRNAAASEQIHLHSFAGSPAIRQACDTFTSEHPKFERTFIENGAGQVLLFEKKSSLDPPAT